MATPLTPESIPSITPPSSISSESGSATDTPSTVTSESGVNIFTPTEITPLEPQAITPPCGGES